MASRMPGVRAWARPWKLVQFCGAALFASLAPERVAPLERDVALPNSYECPKCGVGKNRFRAYDPNKQGSGYYGSLAAQKKKNREAMKKRNAKGDSARAKLRKQAMENMRVGLLNHRQSCVDDVGHGQEQETVKVCASHLARASRRLLKRFRILRCTGPVPSDRGCPWKCKRCLARGYCILAWGWPHCHGTRTGHHGAMACTREAILQGENSPTPELPLGLCALCHCADCALNALVIVNNV
eukprot:scaffold3199_cov402-Prasinococcus_capsulatus_cf.AAC.1